MEMKGEWYFVHSKLEGYWTAYQTWNVDPWMARVYTSRREAELAVAVLRRVCEDVRVLSEKEADGVGTLA